MRTISTAAAERDAGVAAGRAPVTRSQALVRGRSASSRPYRHGAGADRPWQPRSFACPLPAMVASLRSSISRTCVHCQRLERWIRIETYGFEAHADFMEGAVRRRRADEATPLPAEHQQRLQLSDQIYAARIPPAVRDPDVEPGPGLHWQRIILVEQRRMRCACGHRRPLRGDGVVFAVAAVPCRAQHLYQVVGRRVVMGTSRFSISIISQHEVMGGVYFTAFLHRPLGLEYSVSSSPRDPGIETDRGNVCDGASS